MQFWPLWRELHQTYQLINGLYGIGDDKYLIPLSMHMHACTLVYSRTCISYTSWYGSFPSIPLWSFASKPSPLPSPLLSISINSSSPQCCYTFVLNYCLSNSLSPFNILHTGPFGHPIIPISVIISGAPSLMFICLFYRVIVSIEAMSAYLIGLGLSIIMNLFFSFSFDFVFSLVRCIPPAAIFHCTFCAAFGWTGCSLRPAGDAWR